jgi:hypothetical protein
VAFWVCRRCYQLFGKASNAISRITRPEFAQRHHVRPVEARVGIGMRLDEQTGDADRDRRARQLGNNSRSPR